MDRQPEQENNYENKSERPDRVLNRWPAIVLGHVFVVLACLGAILPLLPTTPFLLVAAYFYSRGSPHFHTWLLNLPKFGPLIRDWQEHGTISRATKVTSTTLMLAAISYPLIKMTFHPVLKAIAGATVVFAIVFIWSRPSKN